MEQKNKVISFESYPGDPLKARIYTLENGLKVFLSVFRESPRIQTYIAVRAGSKMDPHETTGLAHYFEHMMFKGTESFGTIDWEKEHPIIDSIIQLFEKYRTEEDEFKRAQIYKEIDSLSYEASKIAIPNEYDKLMDAIGSQSSNAGTSVDYTIYQENIPSNQVENWAMIQNDRFSHPVLRLFHTELETVYEEKNMSLTNDSRKVNEAILSALFPNHPYGTQTTLGKAEHLRNPSMKNILEFFTKYYVPNNMAISMSGDFNPDEVILIIDKYFGKLKPRIVEPLQYDPWRNPDQLTVCEVYGMEAENVSIAYGFNCQAKDKTSAVLYMISNILSNGKAGLIDLNLSQAQKVLIATAWFNQMADYAAIVLSAKPKSGQTLQEVKNLLLCQIEELRKGNFPDWMLEATVNNAKLNLMKQYESNQGRAMSMASSFLYDISYSAFVEHIQELKKITRQDILAFVDQYFANNYVIVFKQQGQPGEIATIKNPSITPVYINRDAESIFLKKIQKTEVPDIHPVFLDYKKEIKQIDLPGKFRALYKKNKENSTFTLSFYYSMGKNHDKIMNFALSYLPFLGSGQHSAEQIKQEFYRLACSFNAISLDEETSLSLTGLDENFSEAILLLEELLEDPQPDSDALQSLISNTLRTRNNSKAVQQEIFNALISFGTYGPSSPVKNILSGNELQNLTTEELIEKIKELKHLKHRILYYGPRTSGNFEKLIIQHHRITPPLKEAPAPLIFHELPTSVNRILFVDYDAKQSKVQSIINEGIYDSTIASEVFMLNNYFGNNLVFQELREKRALAYTAYSRFVEAADQNKFSLVFGYIATQNDKIADALTVFNELYDSMPEVDVTFNVSRTSLLNRISAERITKMSVIWNFINAEKHGLNYDIRKNIFEIISCMRLENIRDFSGKVLKNRAKTYVILGRDSETDFSTLERFGPVQKLSLEDIFGY
ncbi:MAG: insulinase family protein [Bacteroidetes bacterium]|nr:insulinase family protein [Bacteroidota bacterium]